MSKNSSFLKETVEHFREYLVFWLLGALPLSVGPSSDYFCMNTYRVIDPIVAPVHVRFSTIV